MIRNNINDYKQSLNWYNNMREKNIFWVRNIISTDMRPLGEIKNKVMKTYT